MQRFVLILFSFLILLLPRTVLAHCPLCTVGAGFLAAGAAYLGVSGFSIGIFIGAFAIALGLWFARYLPRKIYGQTFWIALASFLLTLWPLSVLIPAYFSYYVSLGGEYGSLLNRTYYLSQFWVAGVIGGVIVMIAPWLSRKLSVLRQRRMFPFQGIAITFGLLLFISLTFELLK